MAIEPSDDLTDYLDLVDYRRRVSDLYTDLRRRGVDGGSWKRWRDARNELLSTHPRSPLLADGRTAAASEGIDFFAYDPSWQVVAAIEPDDGSPPPTPVAEGSSTFAPIATLVFERRGAEHRLVLFWLEAYGGGLFLPFGDRTNGTTTFGTGRYLLDGAKSADLGSPGPGRLLLDFNFSYHPSCVWDPQWACPLAPSSNRLSLAIEAGERRSAVGERG